MAQYLNLLGWFTFADGFRAYFSTYRGGRDEFALCVMEHGEVVRFEA